MIEQMSQFEAARVLGVRWPCSIEEINAAYKQVSLRAHPDRGGSNEWMAMVNNARETLIKLAPRKEPHVQFVTKEELIRERSMAAADRADAVRMKEEASAILRKVRQENASLKNQLEELRRKLQSATSTSRSERKRIEKPNLITVQRTQICNWCLTMVFKGEKGLWLPSGLTHVRCGEYWRQRHDVEGEDEDLSF